MSSVPSTKSIKLPLKFNKHFKHDGAASMIRAAHRYGFTHTTCGYFVAEKAGGGHKVLRKQHHSSSAHVGTAGTTEVPVVDVQNDLEYTVDVLIGTPGVKMSLDFDTGSSDLWVWSSELAKSVTSGHVIYDPAKSSTAQKQSGASWNISYGDGSAASGDVYSDTVTIGDIVIPGQSVELAKKLSASFLSDGSEGLLGLAWPAINTVKPKPAKTPVEQMIQQSLIAQPIFTVKLTHAASGEAGFYTFGEIDPAFSAESIDYTPVDNSQGFWSFPSTSWTINGETQELSGGTAIADTGTTLQLLPDDVVTKIYAAIDGSKLDSTQGGYVFPSSSAVPTLSFAVGDKQYQVSAETLAFGDAENGFVFGGIQSSGNLGFSIFGDVFLKNVYVVFDQGNARIGMVQR